MYNVYSYCIETKLLVIHSYMYHIVKEGSCLSISYTSTIGSLTSLLYT